MDTRFLIFPLLLAGGCASWDNTLYPRLNRTDMALIHQVEHLRLDIEDLANRGARACLPGQLQVLQRLYQKAKQEAEAGFDRDVRHSLIDADEQVHLISHQLDWLEEHTQCVNRGSLAQERRQLMLYFSVDNQFALDQAALLPDYQQALRQAATILKRRPDWHITLTGYTDAKASAAYNRQLGLNRANRVKAYLVELGVAPAQLTTQSRGDQLARAGASRTRALAERTVIAELSEPQQTTVPEPGIHAIRHWHQHL
ncbi:OmpA family protein [Photobacterium atrarenae]|uniref:OmpA family protein n=1 Tax=Photobacterium atrarenae TaxID=865757 RepID=A0ABY5GC07_9GAMM|nr:OmpA family protein [Photobacterium atrarenae]UTV26738.1 OmpA family protein [Photobacterium atrarenae]